MSIEPEKLKRPLQELPEETKEALDFLLDELEKRRLLLNKKLSLSQLEKPFKFTMK